MSTPAQLPQDFWLYLPFLVVGCWLTISFVVSLGWQAFATRYRAGTRPAGKAHTAVTARIGWSPFSSYKNVVKVVFTKEGVYFYVLFLFRPFHSPFLLPWESVRSVEKKDGFLLGKRYIVDVGDDAGWSHLWLRGKVEQDLLRYYPPMKPPVLTARHAFPRTNCDGEHGEDGRKETQKSA
jgi:hypothetical protein